MTAPVVIVGTNSWATIAQADDYFAASYGRAAWSALSLLQKTQLLITACLWIRQQSTLSVPLTDTSATVRNAQAEAAWFIYNWFGEYEKRRALISSGVKTFKVLDFAESLGEVTFPAFIADMLSDYAVSTTHQFPRMSRDLEANASNE